MGWLVGGSCCGGHLQGLCPDLSWGLGTPELVHGFGSGLAIDGTVAGSGVLAEAEATSGKLAGTRPRSMQAVRDK